MSLPNRVRTSAALRFPCDPSRTVPHELQQGGAAGARRLELWAGPEASVTRVGERRVDQLEATGFAQRLDDLDRLAALGAARVRLPVLFERTEPEPGRLDFTWADARLERARALALRPVVGLVHHGCGPAHTQLLDDAFAAKVAGFARQVALRYPWVEDWTPVNEPLTTARFSALYGLWHPHRRDDASFVRALLNQVHAIAASMRAIRTVIPTARLVQTEDLGYTRSTPELEIQARFDNERRWLSLDLLAGRVTPLHPLHDWLVGHGAGAEELAALADDPTPPDIVGLNVYVTSERYLDHRLDRYPPALHGGNGHMRYADTEAVRVHGLAFGGFADRLRDAWWRYRLPLALTEVHLGCTRDEQLRWLLEAWRAGEQLRDEGADVRAVTAWAVFGTHDWDSLMTRARGHYEPGLFDTRGGAPRPTALATLAQELASGRPPSHPALASPGWWRRDGRQLYPSTRAHDEVADDAAPLLIVGGRGTLGQAFARVCMRRGLAHRLLTRAQLDIADADAVAAQLEAIRPWAVVNAAGYVRVDEAEGDAAQWRANALGPLVLAEVCERAGVRVLSYSSDLVFDGGASRPYRESDAANPLNAYGRAKQHAERGLAPLERALVVRTAAFFGPWDEANFVVQGLARLRDGQTWSAIDDQTVSPTYVPDLVDASLDLLLDGERGVWHVASGGVASWYEFACAVAEVAGLPRAQVRRIGTAAAGQRALRPRYSALASERGQLAPALDDALQRCLRDLPAR
jgi:dTDP-4-dehydrorhamnose reductase